MSPRRLKTLSLIAGIVFSALTLLAWTQQWFSLTLSGTEASQATIEVDGGVAAPALAAFSLAGLALVGALSIAGPVIRIVLGVLQLALGAGIVIVSAVAMADPVAVSGSAVTKVLGVSGADSIAALVASSTQTAWPWFAIGFGALIAALGIFILVTGRRWPGSSRRYQTTAAPDGENSTNAVSDWDSLSGGSDPTSR